MRIASCQEDKEIVKGIKNRPSSAPMLPWEFPNKPWKRIYVNFAGPFIGSMFFMTIDMLSKWPEVFVMRYTTVYKSIEVLRTIYARNGVPTQLVNDNGPSFTSV